MSVMYEKGHWSLGTTADHTQGFVTAVNVLGDGYNEEADGITWMTAHISYEVDDRFSVALEGQNLLDAKERYTINGNPLLLQGYNRYGRSFNLGVSIKF